MKTSNSHARRFLRRSATVSAMAAVLVLPLGLAAPAVADGPNLVVNGNFASPVVSGNQVQVTAVPGWTLIDGQAEVDGEAFTPPPGSAAGSQSTDLNPASGPVSIEQTVPTTAGETYTLGYQLAGNVYCGPAVKTGTVSVDGTPVHSINFDTTGRSGSSMGWTDKSYTFTATGPSTTINFQSTTTAGTCGPVITNVSLNATPDAGVPMASWQIGGAALLGLMALFGIGVAVRRRRSLAAA